MAYIFHEDELPKLVVGRCRAASARSSSTRN